MHTSLPLSISSRIDENTAKIVQDAPNLIRTVYAFFVVSESMKIKSQLNGEKVDSGLVVLQEGDNGASYIIKKDFSSLMPSKMNLDDILNLIPKAIPTAMSAQRDGVLRIISKNEASVHLKEKLSLMEAHPELNGYEAALLHSKIKADPHGHENIPRFINAIKSGEAPDPSRQYHGERPRLSR